MAHRLTSSLPLLKIQKITHSHLWTWCDGGGEEFVFVDFVMEREAALIDAPQRQTQPAGRVTHALFRFGLHLTPVSSKTHP